MNADSVGRVLIALGIAAIVVGLLVRFGALGWFGNLPGDIRIETERTRVYIPITSMLLVSIAMSALLSLFRR
jgi:Zn-dependent protease with chaperone function